MGMRVGGAGSSAAMAAWQAKSAPAPAQPQAAASTAVAVQGAAGRQVSAAMQALATGSTTSTMA